MFETKQVFYSSKDDTKIPMFIVHKKGIPLSGNHPTLLYDYGGFNISITPSFSVSRVIFMQHMGGVLAIANIRGGGEYGETWHRGGMLAKKQNCFDDFQHAAEHLINESYTSPNKVMDMLKFQKYTIGHAWTTDFGSSDNEEQFQWLIKAPKSPSQYPSLLLLTGDHDDRVVPHHSLKYIATVQDKVGASPNQRNPLLIRVDTKSGHGGGKPTSKIIEETSDIYGFIGRNVDADWLDCSVPVSSSTNRL
ncbi:unnamed protein product [Clavelina lepadiformis]|uniref:Prolyl endopeptidase n=1 Tax=Clavelina lepadiformis TaxID=159417 RepID=A0ABP0FRE3_CLALP